MERLAILDERSNEDLTKELESALELNASLRGALHLLKVGPAQDASEFPSERAMAIIWDLSSVWALGLTPPTSIKLPSSTRNRSKKARGRLQDLLVAFVKTAQTSEEDVSSATEEQHAIVDGTGLLPE